MDYNRKYTCKYCSYRGNREQLITHIENKHPEYISEEYPASRIVYNHLNKVETGHCIICGKPTKWNDKTWKYARHCGSEKCKNAIKDTYRKNAIAARGKYNFLDDSDHLEQMLANRKISGTYTCRNGSKKTYTGSYEKNAIEFMDKVLQCDPDDILMPGPIFEYEYNGTMHKWITDIYYIPYNLVIEVKDGGDNPNKRTMIEYREKQIAKEQAIIKDGTYNYLRLTNNDFKQLLQMFTALRLAMINDEEKTRKALIHINEALLDDVNTEVTCTALPDLSLLFVYDDEVTEKVSYIGLCTMSSNYVLIPTTDGTLESVRIDELPNKVNAFVINSYTENGLNTVIDAFKNKKPIFDSYNICKILTGKEFIYPSDIALFESWGILKQNLIESSTFTDYTNNALKYDAEDNVDSTYITKMDENIRKTLIDNNIELMENPDGYFLRYNKDVNKPSIATLASDLDTTLGHINAFIQAIKIGGDNNG